MLIKRYGEYLLRGHKQAALNAFVWSLIPLMGWLGTAIIGLVTLRKGALQGFLVLAWIIVPAAALFLLGHPEPLVYGVLCGSLVAWFLSVILRETGSWSLLLQAGTLLAMAVVLVIHSWVPDLHKYWFGLLSKYYTNAETAFALKVTAEQLQYVIKIMAKIATGSQAAVLLLITLFNVLVARWWQAFLFNPGGLAKELLQVRLNVLAVLCLAAVLLCMWMGVSAMWDLLPLALLLFFVAGFSLIHAMSKTVKAMWAFLLTYYALLIFFFPYMGMLTVILAMIDVFVDFRGRIKQQLAN